MWQKPEKQKDGKDLKNTKNVTQESIDNFMKHFNNLPTIIDMLGRGIGFAENNNNQPTRLKPEIELSQNEQSDSTPITVSHKGPTQVVTFINNIPFYLSDSGIEGLNRIKNTNIYLSPSPLLVNQHQVDELDSSIPQEQYEIAVHTLGKSHLIKMINRVANQNVGKQITIIVLGKDAEEQNLEVYQNTPNENEFDASEEDYAVVEQDIGATHLKKYLLRADKFRTKSQKAKVDAEIYYFDVYDDTVVLTSRGLNQLYALINSGNPLIIHDYDGIDLAPKFALSLKILNDFNKCFEGSNQKITANLLVQYNELRNSHSSHALLKLKDVEQAIYLAFYLKMYEIEKNVTSQIPKLQEDYKNDPGFKSRNDSITDLLQLLLVTSYEDRADLINTTIVQNTELQEHHEHAILSKIRPDKPKHYTLLKLLEYCYSKRSLVARKSSEIFNCKGLEAEKSILNLNTIYEEEEDEVRSQYNNEDEAGGTNTNTQPPSKWQVIADQENNSKEVNGLTNLDAMSVTDFQQLLRNTQLGNNSTVNQEETQPQSINTQESTKEEETAPQLLNTATPIKEAEQPEEERNSYTM